MHRRPMVDLRDFGIVVDVLRHFVHSLMFVDGNRGYFDESRFRIEI
jgi:hypothetical protein